MQVWDATCLGGEGLVASVAERAAVAELMTPSESRVGRPPRYLRRSAAQGALLLGLLISPSEPDDDE